MKKLCTAALVLVCGAAQAQVIEVDPSGQDAPDVDPGGDGQPVSTPPNGQPTTNPNATEPEGYYIEGSGTRPTSRDPMQPNGPRGGEEVHVVERGDTLWDICQYYFSDPWKWPEIWAYNPSITNPHWIYPGDVVRLRPAGQQRPVAASEPTPRIDDSPTIRLSTELRQLAFVTLDDLKISGRISGSTEDKSMLTQGDEVYVEYPEGKPLQVGRRYAVYTESKDIAHPVSKAKVGAFVRVLGEVEVVDVKKGKPARAILTYVTDVVERGDRVGTLKTQFKDVEPVAASKDLEGVIVAMIGTDQLIGDGQVVFLDRGKDDGLKVGNRMQVVRRGDAYPKQKGYVSPAGQDDRRFPDNTIGDVVVVETAATTSLGWMVGTEQETFVGDHVVMRKGR
jgi:hypothetical protein